MKEWETSHKCVTIQIRTEGGLRFDHMNIIKNVLFLHVLLRWIFVDRNYTTTVLVHYNKASIYRIYHQTNLQKRVLFDWHSPLLCHIILWHVNALDRIKCNVDPWEACLVCKCAKCVRFTACYVYAMVAKSHSSGNSASVSFHFLVEYSSHICLYILFAFLCLNIFALLLILSLWLWFCFCRFGF